MLGKGKDFCQQANNANLRTPQYPEVPVLGDGLADVSDVPCCSVLAASHSGGSEMH